MPYRPLGSVTSGSSLVHRRVRRPYFSLTMSSIALAGPADASSNDWCSTAEAWLVEHLNAHVADPDSDRILDFLAAASPPWLNYESHWVCQVLIAGVLWVP